MNVATMEAKLSHSLSEMQDPATEMSPATMPLADLMIRFESLGENCEFGLVQRKAGAEPLGLLRFSSTPLPKLLAALRARFEGLGRADTIKVELGVGGREYMILDKTFGLYYHAWVLVGERPAEDVHRREIRRLPYLVRKLIEDLTEGEKIFVYRSMTPISTAQAMKLVEAIQAYGPATLLWMDLSDPGHPPGSVEWLAPGLMRGRMDRFAPGSNAHDFSFGCWEMVCRAALALKVAEAK